LLDAVAPVVDDLLPVAEAAAVLIWSNSTAESDTLPSSPCAVPTVPPPGAAVVVGGTSVERW